MIPGARHSDAGVAPWLQGPAAAVGSAPSDVAIDDTELAFDLVPKPEPVTASMIEEKPADVTASMIEEIRDDDGDVTESMIQDVDDVGRKADGNGSS